MSKDGQLSLSLLGRLKDFSGTVTTAGAPNAPRVELIQIDRIYSRSQPRQVFEKIEELAESLRSIGLQQPVIVNPDGEGKYVVEQGERRWRAAKLAGLHVLTCVVVERPEDDRERFLRQLTENVQRDNMKLHELAQAVAKLVADGMTIKEIAQKLGKKAPYISILNAVAVLPPELDEAVRSGLVQDPVGARRLQKLYETHKTEVSAQLKRWEKLLRGDDDEEGASGRSSISRAQIKKFEEELLKAEEKTDKAKKEADVAAVSPNSEMENEGGADNDDDDGEGGSLFSNGEDGGADSGMESCTPAAPDRLVIRVEVIPSGIGRVSDKDDEAVEVTRGEIALDVLPPMGKLCLILDTSGKRMLVDADRVQIIGTELR